MHSIQSIKLIEHKLELQNCRLELSNVPADPGLVDNDELVCGLCDKLKGTSIALFRLSNSTLVG